MTESGATLPLPRFDVQLAAPDIAPWRAGNAGIPGVMTFRADRPGPHVALFAATHGNELAGVVALDRLLRVGLRPRRGQLSFVFHHLEAFDSFDPNRPTESRYIDEDLNRVWAAEVLDGPRQSRELKRARALRPLVDRVDVQLDLHSMLWPSDPLILSGPTARGRDLALAIGAPPTVVADDGHAAGRRMMDYARFTAPDGDAIAMLVEAGQHWAHSTVDVTLAAISGLLHRLAMVDPHPALPPPPIGPSRFAEVTHTITARCGDFAFLQSFRGGEVVPRRNTLIALDGDQEIRTQYDDCLLVMPSLRPSRGHTAVRLARFIAPEPTTRRPLDRHE